MFVVGRHHSHAFTQNRRSNPAWPWLLATGVMAAAAGGAGYLYCQPRRIRSGKVTDPLYAEILSDSRMGTPELVPPGVIEAIGPAQYECTLEFTGCFQGQDAYEIVLYLDGVRLEGKKFSSREEAEAYWENYFGQGGTFVDMLKAGNRPGQPLVGEYPPGTVPDPQVLDNLAAQALTQMLENDSGIRPGFQIEKIRNLHDRPTVCGVSSSVQLWKVRFQRSLWGDEGLSLRPPTVTAYTAVTATGITYPTQDGTFQYFTQPFGGGLVADFGFDSEAEVVRNLGDADILSDMERLFAEEVNLLWLVWQAFKRQPENLSLLEFLGRIPPGSEDRLANPLRAPMPVMSRPTWGQLPHIGTAPQFQPPEFPPMWFKRLRNARSKEDENYRRLTACNNFCRQNDGVGNPIPGTWDHDSVNCGKGGICYEYRPKATTSPGQSLLALPSSSLTTSARGIKSSLRTSRRRKRRTGLSTRLTRASKRSRR